MEKQELLELIGNPEEIDRNLQIFRRTAGRLSGRHPRLIEKYHKRWVGLHSGRVRAHGRSLKAVLKGIDAKGLSREHTIVRFIHKEPRTMIL